MTGQQDNSRPRRFEAVRGTWQPDNTELEEDLRVDVSFDEVVSKLARTDAIHRDGSPRRER